jgi:hypothetical protein
MYKGEDTKGIEFYNLLFESDRFTAELGKVTLAAGKLEAVLILFLKNNGLTENLQKATLGGLITKVNKQNILEKKLIYGLEMVCEQRNYLTHNIYALFIDLLDETILEKNNLIDSDVILYIERAWQLAENLNHYAELINEKISVNKSP